ncbi:MAG: prepilin peptidase [Thermoanaerobaculia bacterium]|nr:prepilin peptidase [Thermoanaerobaculia bacterium]
MEAPRALRSFLGGPSCTPSSSLYVGLVGLVVGSYLNVVIHRLPRRQSTVLPRSCCPHCGALIRARDNVPLLSFLLLRGRCRVCRAPISWRYPAIEVLTAVCFVTSFERFGVSIAALAGMILCGLLIALAAIDAELRLLPDMLTLPGIVVGLSLQPWLPWSSLTEAALGALLGGGTLLGASWVWERLHHEEGLGWGDAKMLAMIGAFLGFRGMSWALFAAATTAGVVGGAGLLARRFSLETRLPFGIFLALGAATSLFLQVRG